MSNTACLFAHDVSRSHKVFEQQLQFPESKKTQIGFSPPAIVAVKHVYWMVMDIHVVNANATALS